MSLAGEAERQLVKAIVKRARRPVKSRQIPPDIVAKYRDRLARLEPEIGENLLGKYCVNRHNQTLFDDTFVEELLIRIKNRFFLFSLRMSSKHPI